MAGTFKFELVSPERVLLAEDAEAVVLPGSEGDFAVLVGHAKCQHFRLVLADLPRRKVDDAKYLPADDRLACVIGSELCERLPSA